MLARGPVGLGKAPEGTGAARSSALSSAALRLPRRSRTELSEEQKLELKEAFDLFDQEKTGSIDYHELKVSMRALGFNVKKADVQELMKEYDKQQSGRIDYSDYLEIMTHKFAERDPQEEMLKAFKLFDDDNTGKISLKNLRRVARELVSLCAILWPLAARGAA
eukprot:GHVT01065207.1.p1 GENE.GHVT01065207.1~~GHVT01065207.1.p1  ORF type:complete len:164 (+),score=45.83 GHVT01065207.1:301-792(+)